MEVCFQAREQLKNRGAASIGGLGPFVLTWVADLGEGEWRIQLRRGALQNGAQTAAAAAAAAAVAKSTM